MKYCKGDKFKLEGVVTVESDGLRPDSYCINLVDAERTVYIGDLYVTSRTLDKLEKIEEEIDWDEIKEDTPIYVRNSVNDAWLPRHFAYYDEDGDYVYCWDNGYTSHTTLATTSWNFARLKG